MKYQLIRHQVLNRRIVEEHEGRAAELDDEMRIRCRQPLAGPEIEGNIGPSPIVDGEFHRHECFSPRIFGYIWFLTVAWNALAVLDAGAVLSADCARQNFFRGERLNGV